MVCLAARFRFQCGEEVLLGSDRPNVPTRDALSHSDGGRATYPLLPFNTPRGVSLDLIFPRLPKSKWPIFWQTWHQHTMPRYLMALVLEPPRQHLEVWHAWNRMFLTPH